MKKVARLLAVFFILAGCAKTGEDSSKGVPIKVAYWGGPAEIKIITQNITTWKKDHPGINVILEHTPYDGYTSKILTRIAGRSAPDLMCIEVNLFTAFRDKNIFLDLRPYLAKDASFNIDEFFPEVVRRFSREDKLFGLPRDTAPFACVYYNKRLFDKAGLSYPKDDWTLAELLEYAKALTIKENGRSVQYGFYGWAWQNFVYAYGGSIVDDVERPGRCTLDEPRSIAGLAFYSDMMNRYKVMPSATDIKNLGMGALDMFISGKLAMFNSGIWETPAFVDIKGFDWDVAMFPKGPDAIRGFGTGGSAYCILNTTKHPDEAWEVLKALSGERAQILLAESGLAQPANRRIAEGAHFAGSANKPLNKKMLNDAVKFAIYDPIHPTWREIQGLYIGPELDLVFNGEKSAEEAARKISLDVNKMLKKEETRL